MKHSSFVYTTQSPVNSEVFPVWLVGQTLFLDGCQCQELFLSILKNRMVLFPASGSFRRHMRVLMSSQKNTGGRSCAGLWDFLCEVLSSGTPVLHTSSLGLPRFSALLFSPGCSAWVPRSLHHRLRTLSRCKLEQEQGSRLLFPSHGSLSSLSWCLVFCKPLFLILCLFWLLEVGGEIQFLLPHLIWKWSQGIFKLLVLW